MTPTMVSPMTDDQIEWLLCGGAHTWLTLETWGHLRVGYFDTDGIGHPGPLNYSKSKPVCVVCGLIDSQE